MVPTMMRKHQTRKLPVFKNPEQEAEFWETHSAADYALAFVDVDEVVEDLKARHRPKQNVTFRLEPELMKRLRQKATKAGIRYQTFVREWLWRAVA